MTAIITEVLSLFTGLGLVDKNRISADFKILSDYRQHSC